MQLRERLLEFGCEAVAEVVVEGFSRVKRCSNEGRALMSLDLQVLSNGLQAVTRTRPNLQLVEKYVKAFYLPESEMFHWACTHPEYTRDQVLSLVNLVANAHNWKRKSRMELVERIENGDTTV